MKVLQTAAFSRAVKKLKSLQKRDLDTVINKIMADPNIGEQKRGDLADIHILKFKMSKQLTLLAYNYEEKIITLTMLALGPHENFYRDLKRN